MIIYFGLELNGQVYPSHQGHSQGGIHHFGPQSLLFMLESHLGLIGWPNNNEHLRIEQYRQAMNHWLSSVEHCFFAASFAADQFATASALLSLRDELLLAGWDFKVKKEGPDRLHCLAGIEAILAEAPSLDLFSAATPDLLPGFADRFMAVLKKLDKRSVPIDKIWLNEPLELLPSHFQQLFQKIEKQGAKLEAIAFTPPQGNADLFSYQASLLKKGTAGQKYTLRHDGSLLIVRTKRETDAAAWLTRLLAQNPTFRPLCLIPEKNRALDNALIQEGLPSLGILSASTARPSLQILKLISAFLWHPIDPYKIMEFVSLSVKPLADDLAIEIAKQMAKSPGLDSEGWYIMKNRYFAQLDQRAVEDDSINVAEIRRQFNLWFERKRYNSNKKVPKTEVIEIFDELKKWAAKAFDDSNKKNSSFAVLREQAQRILDLLEELPPAMNDLSMLELERIVRTIYEPSPVVFKEREVDHLPYVHHPSATIANVDHLVWWNFIQNERDHFFSHWYRPEIEYLAQQEVRLQSPQDENALLLWQRPRSVLHCRQRLLLIIPEKVNGKAVFPHPLKDELEACFGDLSSITYQIDTHEGKSLFEKVFHLPKQLFLQQQKLGQPKPFLQIQSADQLGQNEEETFSSLNALFYYPYQWVFRHKISLKQSSILSIVPDITLMGNLSHRFIELLLNAIHKENDLAHWDKTKIHHWVDDQAPKLLAKEGAVLLMYGREPEKIAFLNRIKYAAWSLIAMIQQNGWTIEAIEKSMAGKFFNIPIRGKADLVLSRGQELAIIDLKWRGAARRERVIKNEEDLQLIMYSKLLNEDEQWAHTAYFILENGKMIARNNLAFKEAVAVNPDADHREINEKIWSRMQKTYQWRLEQLQKGQIEIRTKQTLADLEEAYGELLIELLEMRTEDAPFDDYRTLVNLVS